MPDWCLTHSEPLLLCESCANEKAARILARAKPLAIQPVRAGGKLDGLAIPEGDSLVLLSDMRKIVEEELGGGR